MEGHRFIVHTNGVGGISSTAMETVDALREGDNNQ
jgi:hypothetical protein